MEITCKPQLQKFWSKICLHVMGDGKYYTTEKVRWYMPFNLRNEYQYKTSSLLAKLHQLKYLERAKHRSVYHKDNRFNGHRCKWGYRISPTILGQLDKSNQLKLNL